MVVRNRRRKASTESSSSGSYSGRFSRFWFDLGVGELGVEDDFVGDAVDVEQVVVDRRIDRPHRHARPHARLARTAGRAGFR